MAITDRRRSLVVLALLFLAMPACSRRDAARSYDPRHFSTFIDPGLDPVRRIAVLPGERGAAVGRSAATLDEVLPRSFRELARFEVVTLDEETRRRFFGHASLASASVDPDGLRRLRAEYRVDAVLLCRVEQFQSYDPISIGLVAHLVDCRDGGVLWSVTGQWDGNVALIQEDVRDWWDDRIGDDHLRLGGWRTALSTPSLFARYVSDRVAGSARPAPPPE
jgi:hypothetical protein